MSISGDIAEDAYESASDLWKIEWAFNAAGVKYERYHMADGSEALAADDGQSWAFYFNDCGKYFRSDST